MTAVLPGQRIYAGAIEAGALYKEGGKVWPSGFDPSTLTGLNVWLDAADYTPGSWPNRGSAPGPTIFATPVPVAGTPKNGMATVRFKVNEGRLRGDHGLTGTLGHYNFTLIYVTRMVGPNVGRIFTATYPGANYLVGFHTSAFECMYDNMWVNVGTGWPAMPTPWRMYGSDASHDGTNYFSRFFKDGVVSGSTTGGVGMGNLGYNLSGYSATGIEETCDCEVAELLIYNRKLPDPERVEVEDYLRTKWGL